MPPAPPYPEPVEVRHEKGARRLVVTWDDGHVSTYGRSRPIVVSILWPGATRVSSENSANSRSSVRMISANRSGSAVLPGPAGKSVSPENRKSPAA